MAMNNNEPSEEEKNSTLMAIFLVVVILLVSALSIWAMLTGNYNTPNNILLPIL